MHVNYVMNLASIQIDRWADAIQKCVAVSGGYGIVREADHNEIAIHKCEQTHMIYVEHKFMLASAGKWLLSSFRLKIKQCSVAETQL